MYCTRCGVQIEDKACYCSSCGAATPNAAASPWPQPAPRKLMRSACDKKIAGVCGGIAEYLGVDSTLVRIIFLILLFTPPIIFIPYLIAWIVMPKQPVCPIPANVAYTPQST